MRSTVATVLARTMGSCSMTRQIPVPIFRVVVTAAAAAALAKGSDMWMYCFGSSPPAGQGVSRLAGMWVCSGNHSDSKPRSSAAFARTSGGIEYSVLKDITPRCIAVSSSGSGRAALEGDSVRVGSGAAGLA